MVLSFRSCPGTGGGSTVPVAMQPLGVDCDKEISVHPFENALIVFRDGMTRLQTVVHLFVFRYFLRAFWQGLSPSSKL
jgi:hypothetical protein